MSTKSTPGKRLRSHVDPRGLPRGRYTVRVVVTTTRGKRIVRTRRYRTCVPTPCRKARSDSRPAVLYAAGRDAQDYLFSCRMLGARRQERRQTSAGNSGTPMS